MKFQVYAGSLFVACDAYIAAKEKAHEQYIAEWIMGSMQPRTTGCLWWKKTITKTEDEARAEVLSFFTGRPELTKERRIRAVAKHKQSNILLEVTDEEIGDIALYLPDEGKNERI